MMKLFLISPVTKLLDERINSRVISLRRSFRAITWRNTDRRPVLLEKV